MIEIMITFGVLSLGIMAWAPFFNNVYGHDVAGAIYWVDRMKKGELTFYKDVYLSPIGHIMHIVFMLAFWKKENTRAFYWIMGVYCGLSSCVLFWTVKMLFGLFPGIFASVLFSMYIVSPRLDGNWGPFEQLLPLPLMGSVLCILVSKNHDPYILVGLAGMLFGYSILIKQITVLYLPGFWVMILGVGHGLDALFGFVLSMFIANLIPLAYYSLRHKAFWEYLTCNWLHLIPSALRPKKYNELYPKTQVQGAKDPKIVKQVIKENSRSLPPLLFLSVVGIVTLAFREISLMYAGLLFCCLVSVLPIFMRGTFFGHYWLNMIPWLAIFGGVGLGEVITGLWSPEHINGGAFAGALAVGLLLTDAVRADKKYYRFSKDPYGYLNRIWGEELADRYRNWKAIGKYIKDTTKPENRIIVCGWVPHVLMYSDRTHFTPEPCNYTEDYFKIYNRKNPAFFDFLNAIYKFKKFDVVKQKENPFHKGYPEVIVFGEGKVDIDGFEKLTGIKYSLDEKLGGYPLYRADLELTALMEPFERRDVGTQNCAGEPLAEKQLLTLIHRKDWDGALKCVKRLLATAPLNLHYIGVLGDCLINLQKFKLLFDFYRRLIDGNVLLENARTFLLNKVGEAYCRMDKYDDARKVFENILETDPENTTSLNNLGFVYFKQNKEKMAFEAFQKVLKVDPRNEDAAFNLRQIDGG